jgi:Holliday junction DNA helicase RuvA
MISYLIGTPILERDALTMLVGGVGYGVRVHQKCQKLAALAAKTNQQFELFIYTHVREDVLELFGFSTRQERELFLLLIDVSGVGPKTALLILQTGSAQVVEAVQQADASFFAAVPRVGKKLAQKIIIDLRTKLGALKELDLGPVSPQHQEVALALQTLGFSEREIHQALENIQIENLTVSEAITMTIKEIGKK